MQVLSFPTPTPPVSPQVDHALTFSSLTSSGSRLALKLGLNENRVRKPPVEETTCWMQVPKNQPQFGRRTIHACHLQTTLHPSLHRPHSFSGHRSGASMRTSLSQQAQKGWMKIKVGRKRRPRHCEFESPEWGERDIFPYNYFL